MEDNLCYLWLNVLQNKLKLCPINYDGTKFIICIQITIYILVYFLCVCVCVCVCVFFYIFVGGLLGFFQDLSFLFCMF